MPERNNAFAGWFRRANSKVLGYRKRLTTKHYFLAAILLLLFFLFGYDLKAVIVVSVLGLLASYSMIYKRYLRIPSAIELVTFGTVMTSIGYGATAGAIFAIVTTLAGEIISTAVDFFTLVYVVVRALMAFAVYYLFYNFEISITTLGVLAAVFFFALTGPIYMLPGDLETKIKATYFFSVNVIFNLMIFAVLGKLVLGIIL
ncbi:hypothetical protein JXB11_02535 [Candidatus Woesearchaeota archaeon]|nr:hypothetical protein [Candidatus Woesearchaeota archaeon]